MKPRVRALEVRLAKLEQGRLPVPSYVVTLTHDELDLPDAERNEIVRQRAGGRMVAVMPEKCANGEEWVARYARN